VGSLITNSTALNGRYFNDYVGRVLRYFFNLLPTGDAILRGINKIVALDRG
jgi:hypothetical protein